MSNSSDAPATPRDSPHLSAAGLDAAAGSFPHISPDPLDHMRVGERAPAAGGAVIDELPMGPFDAATPRKLTACILPVAPRISSAPILNHVVLTLKS